MAKDWRLIYLDSHVIHSISGESGEIVMCNTDLFKKMHISSENKKIYSKIWYMRDCAGFTTYIYIYNHIYREREREERAMHSHLQCPCTTPFLNFSRVTQKVVGANGIIVHHMELQGIRGFLSRTVEPLKFSKVATYTWSPPREDQRPEPHLKMILWFRWCSSSIGCILRFQAVNLPEFFTDVQVACVFACR